MANISEQLSFSQLQGQRLKLTEERIFKISLVLLIYSVFIYINCVMFLAMSTKPSFRETSRYILFGHMLANDILHLLTSMFLYLSASFFLEVLRAVCGFIVLVSASTFTNAPLNLAVMALERYLAVCFPLRHGELSTPRRTFYAIAVIWVLCSLNMLIDVFALFFTEASFFSSVGFCAREQLVTTKWQRDKSLAFNILFFTLVGLVLLYTYVAIMLEARSVKSDRASANKAKKTVLLHAIQLSLSLLTFLYGVIEVLLATLPAPVYNQLRFINYIVVLLLPRCLSSLIYGLRDRSVKPVFMYYFTCGTKKVEPARNLK